MEILIGIIGSIILPGIIWAIALMRGAIKNNVALENRIGGINSDIGLLNNRLEHVESRHDNSENRISTLESSIARIDKNTVEIKTILEMTMERR